MMQPCDKLLLRCAWEGKVYDCNKIFKPMKSIEGFCCAFNYHVDTSENSMSVKNLQNQIHFYINPQLHSSILYSYLSFGVKASKKNLNVSSAVRHNLTKEEPGVFEVLVNRFKFHNPLKTFEKNNNVIR